MSGRVFKNVMSAAEARQNEAKKRSLHVVNEHFEPNFNAASASAVVFQHPATGFTLIELLISLTIMAVILVIISGALRIGVKAWEAGERDVENNQRLQIVLSLIQQQLSSAAWTEINREGQDSYCFGGKRDFVEFISNISIIPGNEFGKVYVVYRIKTNDKNHQSLEVAEQSLGMIRPDARLFEPRDDEFYELISDADDMHFGFLNQSETGEPQWDDNFISDKDSGLPKAVVFVLKMEEKSPPVSVVARLSAEQDILQKTGFSITR